MTREEIEDFIDDYIDMGCFAKPDVARPYLLDGFSLAQAEIDRLRAELDQFDVRNKKCEERDCGLLVKISSERDSLRAALAAEKELRALDQSEGNRLRQLWGEATAELAKAQESLKEAQELSTCNWGERERAEAAEARIKELELALSEQYIKGMGEAAKAIEKHFCGTDEFGACYATFVRARIQEVKNG